ncbi:MAG: molybdopterin molybdotransferase MoeA [Sarcina sp.]
MSKKDFFKAISVDEAIDAVSNFAKTYSILHETIYFENTLRRITFEDIKAPENVPTFNKSRMDGYALRSQETNGSSESIPSLFKIIGDVHIGTTPNIVIGNEEAVYVPTGARIPEGADSIVMIENTEKISDDELLVYKSTYPNENITLIGEDVSKNDLIIKKGTKITPFHIGLLASLGITEISVYKKPKVTILSTGDELVPATKKLLEASEIRDINSYCLKSQLKDMGYEVLSTTILKDNYNILKAAILESYNDADLVIMSGGSSVGEMDYMYKLLEELGTPYFHGIRMKPGKPVLFGEINNKAFFGLPGNPVSCALACDLLLSPFIDTLTTTKNITLKNKLELTRNLHSAPGKDTFQMVDIIDNKAIPIFGRSSMIGIMSSAKGYIRIKENKEGEYEGQLVEINFLGKTPL